MITFGRIIFFFSIFSIVNKRFHVLSLLLTIEIIIIGIFLILIIYILIDNIVIMMVYLVVSICEARIGIGLLVLIVYFSGRDYLNNLEVIGW